MAVGNIHGAISKAKRSEKKVAARLSIEHLKKLQNVTSVPMVLHGGSGIQQQYILEAVQNGIAKINIGTIIRQAYEKAHPRALKSSALKSRRSSTDRRQKAGSSKAKAKTRSKSRPSNK